MRVNERRPADVSRRVKRLHQALPALNEASRVDIVRPAAEEAIRKIQAR